jgi:hypothetical protein
MHQQPAGSYVQQEHAQGCGPDVLPSAGWRAPGKGGGGEQRHSEQSGGVEGLSEATAAMAAALCNQKQLCLTCCSCCACACRLVSVAATQMQDASTSRMRPSRPRARHPSAQGGAAMAYRQEARMAVGTAQSCTLPPLPPPLLPHLLLPPISNRHTCACASVMVVFSSSSVFTKPLNQSVPARSAGACATPTWYCSCRGSSGGSSSAWHGGGRLDGGMPAATHEPRGTSGDGNDARRPALPASTLPPAQPARRWLPGSRAPAAAAAAQWRW